mgnify:CR=1 FL=1
MASSSASAAPTVVRISSLASIWRPNNGENVLHRGTGKNRSLVRSIAGTPGGGIRHLAHAYEARAATRRGWPLELWMDSGRGVSNAHENKRTNEQTKDNDGSMMKIDETCSKVKVNVVLILEELMQVQERILFCLR